MAESSNHTRREFLGVTGRLLGFLAVSPISPLEILLGSSTASAAESFKGTELKPGDKHYDVVKGVADQYASFVASGYKDEEVRPPIITTDLKVAYKLDEIIECSPAQQRGNVTWYDPLNRSFGIPRLELSEMLYWTDPRLFVRSFNGRADRIDEALGYLGNPDSVAMIVFKEITRTDKIVDWGTGRREYTDTIRPLSLIVAIKGEVPSVFPYSVLLPYCQKAQLISRTVE